MSANVWQCLKTTSGVPSLSGTWSRTRQQFHRRCQSILGVQRAMQLWKLPPFSLFSQSPLQLLTVAWLPNGYLPARKLSVSGDGSGKWCYTQKVRSWASLRWLVFSMCGLCSCFWFLGYSQASERHHSWWWYNIVLKQKLWEKLIVISGVCVCAHKVWMFVSLGLWPEQL